MDWTQALTIIGITTAFFIFMMNRMDAKHRDLNEKIDGNQKQTNERIDKTNERIDKTNEKIDAKFDIVNQKFEGMNQKFNVLENRMTAMESETKTELRNINQRLSTIEGYLVPRKVLHFEEPEHRDEPKEN